MGMKNKHLEHPEDSIFTSGRKGLHNILNFLEEKKSNISVKYDGAKFLLRRAYRGAKIYVRLNKMSAL